MKRLSFNQKLLVTFAALLALVVALNVLFAESGLKNTAYDYIAQSEKALSGSGQEGVKAWLVPRLNLMIATAKQLETMQTLQQARGLLQTVAQGGGFNWVRIGSEQGGTLSNSATADAALPSAFDPRKSAWFKLGQQVKVGDFTDPQLNHSTGQYVITVAVPIRNGPFKGVLGGNINLTTVQTMLHQLKLGGNGYAMLVDDDGTILYAPNRNLVGTKLRAFLGSSQPIEMTADTRTYSIGGAVWRTSFHLIHVGDSHWYLGLFTQRAEIEKPLVKTGWQLMFVTICALAAGMVILYFIVRALMKPVHRMRDALFGLASGEADLTQRLKVDSADEFGEMAEAFNRFVERIQQSMARVSDATTQLTTAAAKLSGTSAEVKRTVSQQQGDMTQLATAIHEMSATVGEVARNTADAAGSAKSARENTQKSSEMVEANADNMRKLAEDIGRASSIVGELHRETENIDKVLEVINSISGQTNLLALNAAIEAARAGEHGRGFAVVADEVRTLASRTQDSTAEIRLMIERLQSGAAKAVDAISLGLDETRESFDHAQQNNALLSATAEAVVRINDMNAMIASAAEEQSAVAEEINRNVSNMHQASDDGVQGVQEISNASERLAQLANELQSLVSGFKI